MYDEWYSNYKLQNIASRQVLVNIKWGNFPDYQGNKYLYDGTGIRAIL